ncbi:MAG: RagB/SusD family nutrient uptake outer membrane protein [Flavobacteriaceae bacterium]|nr:RagB/SusD family nutrient uptake outer membrane protein [Flavobacteriaceae bacterium]
MKKYIIILITLIAVTACDLDLKPESSLSYNGFWESEEAVYAAHTGIYAKYRDYNGTLWQMGELRSDNWGGQTLESPSGTNLIDNDISATKVPFGNWAGFYGFIHYLNDFIKNAPNVEFKNQNVKNHLLGQVHGIRAQIYYTMLKAWGDVPISKEPLTKVDLETLKKGRSPKAEVLAFVKEDIAKSLKYFGGDNSLYNGKNVYWSKAATLALKGDVYLWSGSVLGGGNSDFQEAKKALSQVSGFSLVPYNKLWGQANEGNDEFIFAFDYAQDQAGNFYGNFTARAVDIVNLFDAEGKSVKDFVLNGGSRYAPSDKLSVLLSDVKDARNKTFLQLYDDEGNHIPFVAGNEHYKTSVLLKFLGVVDAGSRKNYNNVPLYRYADVVLMLAEAKNNLGEDPSNEINKIRKRAYGSNFDASVTYTNGSKSANTMAILTERQKEFVAEGKRWWDLVRAGGDYVFDEIETLDKADAYKIYYPISEGMLANDDQLKQTEGY